MVFVPPVKKCIICGNEYCEIIREGKDDTCCCCLVPEFDEDRWPCPQCHTDMVLDAMGVL